MYDVKEMVYGKSGVAYYKGEIVETKHEKNQWLYKIHYHGWGKRHDEWKTPSELLKNTSENRVLVKEIMARALAKEKKEKDERETKDTESGSSKSTRTPQTNVSDQQKQPRLLGRLYFPLSFLMSPLITAGKISGKQTKLTRPSYDELIPNPTRSIIPEIHEKIRVVTTRPTNQLFCWASDTFSDKPEFGSLVYSILCSPRHSPYHISILFSMKVLISFSPLHFRKGSFQITEQLKSLVMFVASLVLLLFLHSFSLHHTARQFHTPASLVSVMLFMPSHLGSACAPPLIISSTPSRRLPIQSHTKNQLYPPQ